MKKLKKHAEFQIKKRKIFQAIGAHSTLTHTINRDALFNKETRVEFLLGLLTISVCFVIFMRLMNTDVSTVRMLYISTLSSLHSLLYRTKYTPAQEVEVNAVPACSPVTPSPLLTIIPTPSSIPEKAEVLNIEVEQGDSFYRIAQRVCKNSSLYDYLYRLNNMTTLHKGDIVQVRCDGNY